MNAADKVGKVFLVDLKAEIQEIERLGLDEGLGLLKTLAVKVTGKGSASTAKFADKEAATRQRATAVVQEVYMGQFEVSDAAVNMAMMNLRDDASAGVDPKESLILHEQQVEVLKTLILEEQTRQYEDLSLKAEPLGFDLAPSLALWTLPSEMVGGGLEAGGADKESLQKQVAALKLELKAAKERIAYLEGSSSVTAAAKRIRELHRDARAAGGAQSKACVIS